MKKIDKSILLALSAPTGFVVCSVIFYYGIKALSKLPYFSLGAGLWGLEALLILPFAAVLGSYSGVRLAQILLKYKVSLLRTTVGAILGYELGITIELALLAHQRLPSNRLMFYCISVVVLLCGYLGALIGARLSKTTN